MSDLCRLGHSGVDLHAATQVMESGCGVGVQKTASNFSLLKLAATCGRPRFHGRLLLGIGKRSHLTAQDGRSARATQACAPRRKKETLRASTRTHHVSGLRAPKAFKNGALRHKQLHAGRSDRPEVFFFY